MATDDEDFLTSPVPEPDATASPVEKARAKTFADLVDKVLDGRTPPAMSADDRTLLEVAMIVNARTPRSAAVIQASNGNAELAPDKQRSIIEDALRQAIGGGVASSLPDVIPITSATKRWVPWAVATGTSLVAVAALAMLWLRTPQAQPVTATAATPDAWTSRPADALIGPIDRSQAGDASARIDTIFADRMDGFRDRRLSRGGKR